MTPIGLDIGGANIKASDGAGRSISRQYPIWKSLDSLVPELRDLLAQFPPSPHIAATMTAELADCFLSKSDGVTTIVEGLVAAAPGRRLRFWQTAGEFVDPGEAKEFPTLTAASNWHALATWAGRIAPHGCALLVDVGSTTCDIIPIESGLPQPTGRTDLERLRSGELVYTGVKRTPLCAVAQQVVVEGESVPVAAELFATTRDLYLITGDLDEQSGDCDTADGRPATRSAALNRLAHMLCCDRSELSELELTSLAESFALIQSRQLSSAIARVIERMPQPVEYCLFAGEGEFLARRAIVELGDNSRQLLLSAGTVSLTQLLGPTHSQAACAFALSHLARERDPMSSAD